MTLYRVHDTVRRWVLSERRARWLVRSIPDRENQQVYYERRRFGYRVVVQMHYPAAEDAVRRLEDRGASPEFVDAASKGLASRLRTTEGEQ